MPMQRESIQRRRLSDEVFARLEQMIHSGEFEPGDQLPSERDLMGRFGVGRPSVREALFSLQRMGLVETHSGERARVRKPTAENLLNELGGTVRHFLADEPGVRHFQEARAFFEIGLARYAAEHASENDLARLRQALAENEAALDDMDAFERTDVAFHFVLAEIPRNPVFVAIHEAVVAWLREQRNMSLRVGGVARGAYEWHARIFEAVAARDPERAAKAIQGHLSDVAHLYWRAKEGDT